MKLSPHRLTHELRVAGIRSLIGFSNLVRPLVHSVLYHQRRPLEAAPNGISRRTGTHEVGLAFQLYHQSIQAVFNRHWFGPRYGVTRTSSWPRVDHLASRLFPATERPFRTRFRCGSLPLNLATENN